LTNTEVVGRCVSTASYPKIVRAVVTVDIGVNVGVAVEIGKRKAVSISIPIATPPRLYQPL